MNFKLCTIKNDYIEYLRGFCKTISFNKEERRPYVGILLKLGDFSYFAPLSSPKEKHKKMKSQIDFIKIKEGKLGIINLNNAIPIPKEKLEFIDIFLLKKSAKKEEKLYGTLCTSQLIWCNDHQQLIKKKFEKLYVFFKENRLPSNIKSRCCDFSLLEEKLDFYLKKKNSKIPKKRKEKEENER